MHYLMEHKELEHCPESKYSLDIKLVDPFQTFSDAEQANLWLNTRYCSLRMTQGS